MRKIIIATAILALATSPVFAGGSEPKTTAIRVGDLDLASPDGQKILRHRTGRALERVCGAYTNPDPWVQDRITVCRTETKASIDRQLAARLQPRTLAAR